MRKNTLIILVLVQLFMMSETNVFAQENQGFFGMSGDYSAFGIDNRKYTVEARLGEFQFENWSFIGVEYLNNADDFFDIPLDKYSSTNTFTFTIYEKDLSKYVVKAVEINLYEKTPLSQLEYKLLSSNEDANSEYFLIAYLLDSTPNPRGDFVPLARLIAYLDDSSDLKAELLSLNNRYFISSTYRYINLKTGKLQNSQVPGIFILEKSDQKVLAVLNTLKMKVLWKVDSLTIEEAAMVSFFVGVFNTYRFKIGDSDRLGSASRYVYKKTEKNKAKEDKFLIDEDSIILPDQLSKSSR